MSAVTSPGPAAALDPAPGVDEDLYDALLERLHAFAPEYGRGQSNHGPLALDALAALGLGAALEPFALRYARRLVPAAAAAAPLQPAEQRAALGRSELFAAWLGTFRRELAQAPAREVLARWIPQLADGMLAAALHGPLRTCHALRALARRPSAPRLEELAQGLAYWAARHQRLPGAPRHGAGGESLERLLERVPLPAAPPPPGLISEAVRAAAADHARLTALVSRPRAQDEDALSLLARAGARALLRHPAEAIAFVHAVTAPARLRELERWVSPECAARAADYLWQACAALLATYAFGAPVQADAPPLERGAERASLCQRMLESGDEHAIKLGEAALAEHARCADPALLQAAALACARLRAS